ncbi:hypothetical protein EMMF5_004930 [Cystobasidiomycetes sp. EMM_F5]
MSLLSAAPDLSREQKQLVTLANDRVDVDKKLQTLLEENDTLKQTNKKLSERLDAMEKTVSASDELIFKFSKLLNGFAAATMALQDNPAAPLVAATEEASKFSDS